MTNDELILSLHEIGAVKFGQFTLKSGIQSPIYLDLRVMVSYPNVLCNVSEKIWEKSQYLSFDKLCGVPYTALPIATAMSVNHELPMVMRRKEVKEYGTRRAVEGSWQKGEHCLVIEDLVTSGKSVLETVTPLREEGLRVTDVIAVIDREQGGSQLLADQGLLLHSLFTLTEMLSTLEEAGKIVPSAVEEIRSFIQSTQLATP